jgi:hypothetical protein
VVFVTHYQGLFRFNDLGALVTVTSSQGSALWSSLAVIGERAYWFGRGLHESDLTGPESHLLVTEEYGDGRDLVSDGTDLYWIHALRGAFNLERLPTSGGAPSVVAADPQIVTGVFNHGLVVDDERAYFIEGVSPSAVMAVSKRGVGATPVRVGSVPASISALAVDDAAIYFTAEDAAGREGRLYRLAK